MIYALEDIAPQMDPSTWVAPSAHVIGKITLCENSSVWFGAVLRGDNERITIGAGSNVQENSSLHTDMGFPLTVGRDCTIGHNAIVHGCTIGDNVLIGMGAIVMNGAVIPNNCIVGAGALVPEGKTFEEGQLILGSPAKSVRTLSAEQIAHISKAAQSYQRNARRFHKNLTILD